MKKKTLFILLLGGLLSLLLIFISALQITNFSGYSSSENLSFTTNENITRNISIYKNANVTSAYMNLSGYFSEIDKTNAGLGSLFYGYSAGGVTNNGTFVWTTNSTDEAVYKYWINGTYTEDFFDVSVSGVFNVNGITNDNEFIWVASDTNDTLFKFFINGTYTEDSFGSGCGSSTHGLGYYDNLIYISDYSGSKVCTHYTNGTFSEIVINPTSFGVTVSEHRFYVAIDGFLDSFYKNGTYQYRISAITGMQTGRGMTFYNGEIWVADPEDSLIYKYKADDYLNNPYISLNNTQIWNHTGRFNSTYSPNKTSDFSSILNSALNNGKCDCTGCSLSGNNCSIPVIFHSDTAGFLEYSAIDINYTPAPFVILNSPLNNTSSSSIKTFNCSATDETQLSNITFYFWNSTGDLNLSTTINLTGTSNSTTYNMTFNSTDTFTWGCSAFNNNSQSRWADNNFTLNVDISNPAIVLNKPLDSSFINTQNTQFNYTPSHSTQTVDTCELWGNWTGIWHKNQTDTTITEDIANSFTQNLTDGNYLWNVWCNTTETGNSAYSNVNFTFMLDTIPPSVVINSITTTAGSQTISFSNNASDLNPITCSYSIFNSTGSIDGLNNNVSISCNQTSNSATVSAYATYTLILFVTDSASNVNSDSLNFTTSPTISVIITGGGGGAGITKEIATNFTITSSNLLNVIDNGLAKNSKKARTKPFLITNKGIDPITVTVSCDTEETNESTRNISICDYVTFSGTEFVIPPNEQERILGYVSVLTPEDSKLGDIYYFNILAVSKEADVEKYSKLSVSNRVTFLSYVYKWSYLPVFGGEDKKVYPVGTVAFFVGFLFFLLIFLILNKAKMPLTGFLVGMLTFSILFMAILIWL